MSGVAGQSGGHNRLSERERVLSGAAAGHPGRVNEDAPEVEPGNLVVWDEHLGEDGKQLREVFLPILENAGFVGVTDSVVMHKFFRLAEDWFKYDLQCLKKGRHILKRDLSGEVVDIEEAGWSKIEKQLSDRLMVVMRSLGLDPIHRGMIKKICNKEKVNRWALE